MELVVEEAGEGFALVLLAMDEEDGLGLGVADVAEEFEAVGVGAVGVEGLDFGLHGEFVAEDADLLFAVLDAAAEGVFGLVADEEDEVLGVFDAVLEMVEDAAVFAHAGGGDDDGWRFRGGNGFRFLDGLGEGEPVGLDDGTDLPAQGVGFVVEIVGILFKDAGDGLGHGAVDEDGDGRDFAAVAELDEVVDDFLGAAEGERGDEDLAAAAEGADDAVAQFLAGIEGVVVETVAVGGFGDENIDVLELDGIVQEREIAAAEVEGQRDAQVIAAGFRDFDEGKGGAEDVAGIDVGDDDSAGEGHGFVVVVGTDEFEGSLDVGEGIERDDGRLAAAVGLLVQVGGVGLLDVGGIAQHDGQEIGGGRRGVDGFRVALLDEGGDVAAVVDVSVGEDHGVDLGGIEPEGLVDLVGFLAAALKHAAIEENAGIVEFKEVFGAGDLVRAAEKMPLHAGPFAGEIRLRFTGRR